MLGKIDSSLLRDSMLEFLMGGAVKYPGNPGWGVGLDQTMFIA